MLRGTSLFICDDCKTIFMGLDIEWNCLPMSATQQCTKCGGWHTMPGRHLDSPDREFYESLWKREDETGNHHVTCAYRLDELEKYLKKCDEWNSTDHTKEGDEKDETALEDKSQETFLDICIIALGLLLVLILEFFDDIIDKIKSKLEK